MSPDGPSLEVPTAEPEADEVPEVKRASDSQRSHSQQLVAAATRQLSHALAKAILLFGG